MAQCTDGSARWNLNPCDCSVYGGGDDVVRDCQMVHAFMFFVMSYFVVGQAYNTTLVVGTFRSGGDTQFGLILDMSTMWGCSILFGALAAFVFHCNVPVVYMILMSDEIIKIPITWYRYKSYKWLKNVTREEL